MVQSPPPHNRAAAVQAESVEAPAAAAFPHVPFSPERRCPPVTSLFVSVLNHKEKLPLSILPPLAHDSLICSSQPLMYHGDGDAANRTTPPPPSTRKFADFSKCLENSKTSGSIKNTQNSAGTNLLTFKL